MKVRKNDTVLVIAGEDKGAKGKVLRSIPASNRVVVDGVNVQKRHTKARSARETSGILEQSGPIDVSNVMVICPNCGKPTKVGHLIVDGKKIRVCKNKDCGKALDVKEAAETKKAKKADKEVKAKKTSKKKTKVEA